jgi:hypothetical protein
LKYKRIGVVIYGFWVLDICTSAFDLNYTIGPAWPDVRTFQQGRGDNMPEVENTQIDSALSSDVGDETSNRFRYQWVLSAIICCMLLDQAEDVKEVFCEHHEDVLVKHINGLFTGIQVKTRASDQPLWKASDEDVVKLLPDL